MRFASLYAIAHALCYLSRNERDWQRSGMAPQREKVEKNKASWKMPLRSESDVTTSRRVKSDNATFPDSIDATKQLEEDAGSETEKPRKCGAFFL